MSIRKDWMKKNVLERFKIYHKTHEFQCSTHPIDPEFAKNYTGMADILWIRVFDNNWYGGALLIDCDDALDSIKLIANKAIKAWYSGFIRTITKERKIFEKDD